MNIDEVYSNWIAKPCDETSGAIYTAILRQAKIVAPIILDEDKIGSLDEPIHNAAQDIWYRLTTRDIEYDPKRAKLVTLIDRILRNYFIDWIRAENRENFASLDDDGFRLPIDIEAIEDRRIQNIDFKQTIAGVLTEEQLKLVWMKVGGLTEVEIAETLCVDLRTVRRRWHDVIAVCAANRVKIFNASKGLTSAV